MKISRHRYDVQILPIRLAFIILVASIMPMVSPMPVQAACAQVQPGDPIKLGIRDCVEIPRSGYRLTIEKFYNNPCPPKAKCMWSGVGIAFEHSFFGQSMQGIDLIQAFGFDVTVHETDNETYALVSVQRLSDKQ